MKKALLVGINNYNGSPLRGCINDVLVIFQILTSKFGFKTEDIKILTDIEATRQNIVTGLKWLTQGVTDGDTIVFHYSGHGSQVMVDDWSSSSEVDGRDEILCPVNLDWNNPLRDRELGEYFKRVPKACETLVILDCCHSGTGLRNGFAPGKEKTSADWVNRFISPPLSNILSNPALIIKDDLSFDFPDPKNDCRAIKNGFLVETADQGDAILLSGCEDNQTSADAWINNKYQGAMTYMLAHVLAANNYDINYMQLIHTMNAKMDQFKYTQNPQLECKPEFMAKKFLK